MGNNRRTEVLRAAERAARQHVDTCIAARAAGITREQLSDEDIAYGLKRRGAVSPHELLAKVAEDRAERKREEDAAAGRR